MTAFSDASITAHYLHDEVMKVCELLVTRRSLAKPVYYENAHRCDNVQ